MARVAAGAFGFLTLIQVFDGSLIFVTEPVSDCNVGAQSQTDEEEHYQRRLIENHCQNNPDGGNRSRSPDIPGNYCEYGTLPFLGRPQLLVERGPTYRALKYRIACSRLAV